MNKFEKYQIELEGILDKRAEQISSDYLEFRRFLIEVSELPDIAPLLESQFFVLPLFPERRAAGEILRALYKIQGKAYSKEDQVAQPPWAKPEKFSAILATVKNVILISEIESHFEYEYQAADQLIVKGEYSYAIDHMHKSPWYWNEAEVQNRFAVGKKIKGLVSQENSYRHRIFTIYSN